MTTVGQAGAKLSGLPAEAVHRRHSALKSSSATPPASSARTTSATRNEFLPTVHGFDEFFGYLYHLDAMEDPAHPNYPQDLLDKSSVRATWFTAGLRTRTTRPRCRAGARSASRGSRTPGPLYPKRMETVDDEIRDLALELHGQVQEGRQAVLRAGSTRRACTSSRTSREKYEKLRNSAERLVGTGSRHGPARRRHRPRPAEDSRTWVRRTTPSFVFTTDNGTEALHLARRRARRRSRSARAPCMEGGFPRPLHCCVGPGTSRRTPCRTASSPVMDWFPTFLAAIAGNPDITHAAPEGQ